MTVRHIAQFLKWTFIGIVSSFTVHYIASFFFWVFLILASVWVK